MAYAATTRNTHAYTQRFAQGIDVDGTANVNALKVGGLSALAGMASIVTFTQTYSTVTATVANMTVGSDIGAFTDPPSAAEMATLRTFVNALKADVVGNKQVIGKIIDVLQAQGLAL